MKNKNGFKKETVGSRVSGRIEGLTVRGQYGDPAAVVINGDRIIIDHVIINTNTFRPQGVRITWTW